MKMIIFVGLALNQGVINPRTLEVQTVTLKTLITHQFKLFQNSVNTPNSKRRWSADDVGDLCAALTAGAGHPGS